MHMKLHTKWSIPVTCTGGVFRMPACPFTGVQKHMYIWARIATAL